MVPPAALAVAVPSFPPKQLTGVVLAMLAVSKVGWVSVTAALLVQPFRSVTVTR